MPHSNRDRIEWRIVMPHGGRSTRLKVGLKVGMKEGIKDQCLEY